MRVREEKESEGGTGDLCTSVHHVDVQRSTQHRHRFFSAARSCYSVFLSFL